MNWINVEHCTPFTDEEVLCKVDGLIVDYMVCKYWKDTWWRFVKGHYRENDGGWQILPDGASAVLLLPEVWH